MCCEGRSSKAEREHEIDMPLDALVALVATFNQGIILERLSGIDSGHRELLDWLDAWLDGRKQ